MPDRSRALPALLVPLVLVVSACTDASSSSEPVSGPDDVALTRGGGGPAFLALDVLTNGFAPLLPHRIEELDGSGFPTGNIVEVRSLDALRQNANPSNPVFSTPVFPSIATLPSGQPGNHYFVARFVSDPDPASVFDLAGSVPGLTDAVAVTAYDPATGLTTDVPVRVFVGGITAIEDPAGARLQRWVAPDPGAGRLVRLTPQAAGFPGNANGLADPRAIVVVADADGDLSTLETFPTGVQVGVAFRDSLLNTGGHALEDAVFVATTVGGDTISPAVALDSATGLPAITPEDGATDVDPETELTVRFTEPIQPYSIGVIEGTQPPVATGSLFAAFGPPAQRTPVPVAAIPFSPYDLAHYRVVTGFPFFGTPPGTPPNAFNTVDVTVGAGGATDLAFMPTTIAMQTETSFVVGNGTGIVNAPVVPEAVYLLRNEASGGALSIVDLDGFGQSTGNPVTGATFPGPGETRFPFDPNVTLNPTIRPPLIPGTSTIDGGSAGVFRLTLDASLQDRAVFAPTIVEPTDLHIGQPLDRAFRNGPPPFGCLSGGGNVCTLDGLKVIIRTIAPDGGVAPGTFDPFGMLNPGYGNLVSWAPHPNPPTLTFPPQCVSPLLAANEPTAIAPVLTNLLVPGNPFADPGALIPPTGKLALRQNAFFGGPGFGQTQVVLCDLYFIRQQIGHFLYVADRARNEVVVLNSNRTTVIERIPVDGATDLAMHPSLSLLAVSQPGSDSVTFIDVDPWSATFHEVLSTVTVGSSPRGIAWQPEAEDLVVCCEGDRTLHLISGATLQTRNVVSTGTFTPFDVAVAPRQTDFSFRRAVYFAYVLTREGAVVLFESGPDGVNGWGYDDVIGTLPFRFLAPKAIQPAQGLTGAGVYVAHEGPIDPGTGLPGLPGDGAISRVEITSGIVGLLPLVPGSSPQIRDLQYEVTLSIAESAGQLTGIPVDLGFDDLTNLSALPGHATPFSPAFALPANSKSIAAGLPGQLLSGSRPDYLFAAVPETGSVDVVGISLAGA
ncbi:MAG: hypothetical protein AAGI22_27400, partial [Planctomycetota bacterium]